MKPIMLAGLLLLMPTVEPIPTQVPSFFKENANEWNRSKKDNTLQKMIQKYSDLEAQTVQDYVDGHGLKEFTFTDQNNLLYGEFGLGPQYFQTLKSVKTKKGLFLKAKIAKKIRRTVMRVFKHVGILPELTEFESDEKVMRVFSVALKGFIKIPENSNKIQQFAQGIHKHINNPVEEEINVLFPLKKLYGNKERKKREKKNSLNESVDYRYFCKLPPVTEVVYMQDDRPENRKLIFAQYKLDTGYRVPSISIADDCIRIDGLYNSEENDNLDSFVEDANFSKAVDDCGTLRPCAVLTFSTDLWASESQIPEKNKCAYT